MLACVNLPMFRCLGHFGHRFRNVSVKPLTFGNPTVIVPQQIVASVSNTNRRKSRKCLLHDVLRQHWHLKRDRNHILSCRNFENKINTVFLRIKYGYDLGIMLRKKMAVPSQLRRREDNIAET